MSDHVLSYINGAILVILALATLRDVIAKFVLIPRKPGRWWSDILYGRPDRTIIREALHSIGIAVEDVRALVARGQYSSAPSSRARHFGTSPGLAESHLLALLSHYLQTGVDIHFSAHLRIASKYFVNTGSAAHDARHRAELCDLFVALLTSRFGIVDYVLCKKSTNVLLAWSLAEKLNATCILVKDPNDRSYVQTSDALTGYICNFEGGKQLLSRASTLGRPAMGVVVNCNTSSGEELIWTAKEFNRALHTISHAPGAQSITPITVAAVLFRPIADIDVDHKFQSEDLALLRYFDLDEKTKDDIFEHLEHTQTHGFSVEFDQDKRFIEQVLLRMRERLLTEGR